MGQISEPHRTILRDIAYGGWITVENGDTMASMGNSIRFLKTMRARYWPSV